MDISWTTVLCSFIGSIVASGVFSGVVACILGAYIQHKNDKRLAYYKSEIQLILDEHQTRFSWWYQEKAKVIKDFYYSTVILYREMRDFNVIAKNTKEITDRTKKDLEEKINHIIQQNTSSYRYWKSLQLFLKEEELSLADVFFTKSVSVFEGFVSQITHNNLSLDREKIDREIEEMSTIIDSLRKKLQDILKVQEVKS